jgi:hypothetical protein
MRIIRGALILVTMLAVPLGAAAQSYTVALTGGAVVPGPGAEDGSGLAALTLEEDTVIFSILVSGVADPVEASIHVGVEGVAGEAVIDLDPVFVLGMALGSAETTQEVIDAIILAPSSYYLQVTSDAFPQGAVRGQLVGTEPPTFDLYFPVSAAISGEADTFFRTDLRLLNRGDSALDLTLEYFPEGAGGNAGPAATSELTVAALEQAVLDDVVASRLGVTDGKGAIVVRSEAELLGYARIYNDQVAAGNGTFGQLVEGVTIDQARRLGVLPFLSNRDPASGAGARANIGWFNPGVEAVTVTFLARDLDGSVLGQAERTVAGLAQEQVNVAALWPELDDTGDFYVTFSVEGGSLFVYASVVDNVNGDAIYVAAAAD